jgi:type III secretory pathway component EscT
MTAPALQHGASVIFVLLRVLPVVLLCPLLGASLVPGPIRLGISLVVAVWIHGAAGIHVTPSTGVWLGLAVEQLSLGAVMGLAAAWSYDMALAAGRWADLLRGSSAEAFNPATGSRESAGGALLHRLLIASAAAAGALPAMVSELGRSFLWCPPGHFALTGEVLERWMSGMVSAFEVGVLVAAPFALLALSVDLTVAFVQRMAPAFPSMEAALPARLLLGGLFWALDLGPALARLMASGVSFRALLVGAAP